MDGIHLEPGDRLYQDQTGVRPLLCRADGQASAGDGAGGTPFCVLFERFIPGAARAFIALQGTSGERDDSGKSLIAPLVSCRAAGEDRKMANRPPK